ncbi:MAG: hypothetical protein GF344_04665 [Chitinivibrionales bacterium]|nr:hypothetical protein [Chitinivibrionales bacterium]MBD3356316.1 hypothetical protein [Chitinivibrionales bacterium]
MVEKKVKDRAEVMVDALGIDNNYCDSDHSFSPFYSNVGLAFNEKPGIANLFLHYNRKTIAFAEPLVRITGPAKMREHAALWIEQVLTAGKASFAFYERNAWLMETEGAPGAEIRLAREGLSELRFEYQDRNTNPRIVLFTGLVPTLDERDADRSVPFLFGVAVMKGALEPVGHDSVLGVSPDQSGFIRLAFAVEILDMNPKRMLKTLGEAPDMKGARERSRAWLVNALGNCDIQTGDARTEGILARAATSLVTNACAAPGILANRVASFPGRGRYPAHYLWDSCFQNLAQENMDPQLAPDALLLLTENIRIDGKMFQFLCSTWTKPIESHPPMVGWAAWRLVRQRNDKAFAQKILSALRRNNYWWLTQRMTRRGLVACAYPPEVGWGNTPRFERGPIIPVDINAYLLMQVRACASLAHYTGDNSAARALTEQAATFAQTLVRVLYDPSDNLFKDVLVATGERLPLRTPACFTPLLTDVPLDEHKRSAMIGGYLLDPNQFFGGVPFPSLAYNEPAYESGNWWRGPTWMPVAYLMLTVLRNHGFEKQWRQAAERLYTIIVDDGNIREFFDSRTGKGKGAHRYGPTAAVLLRLHMALGEQVDGE